DLARSQYPSVTKTFRYARRSGRMSRQVQAGSWVAVVQGELEQAQEASQAGRAPEAGPGRMPALVCRRAPDPAAAVAGVRWLPGGQQAGPGEPRHERGPGVGSRRDCLPAVDAHRELVQGYLVGAGI